MTTSYSTIEVAPTGAALTPRIYILDDDAMSRELISRLLESLGCERPMFGSAADFLQAFETGVNRPTCVISDVCMPGLDGLMLQKRLTSNGVMTPIVFVSAVAGVEAAVEAMKDGAFDFIPKPLDGQRLQAAVKAALARDEAQKQRGVEKRKLEKQLAQLTPREREVLVLLAEGCSTKGVAARLGISVKTVFVHRARVLEKLGLDNLVQLSQLHSEVVSLGLSNGLARTATQFAVT